MYSNKFVKIKSFKSLKRYYKLKVSIFASIWLMNSLLWSNELSFFPSSEPLHINSNKVHTPKWKMSLIVMRTLPPTAMLGVPLLRMFPRKLRLRVGRFIIVSLCDNPRVSRPDLCPFDFWQRFLLYAMRYKNDAFILSFA